MKISIRPGVLRDVSWIVANMRDQDKAEAYCQLPEGTKGHELAYGLLMGSLEAYVAYIGEEPVMAFGIMQNQSVVGLLIWALGTRKSDRVVPAITRFVVTDIMRRAIDNGYQVMEARSIETHTKAHKWMQSTGAHVEGRPFIFGRDGERFLLFRWTVADYHITADRYARRK